MLNNWYYPSQDSSTPLNARNVHHSDLQPAGSESKPSPKVTLIFQLGDERTYATENGAMFLQIATDLDPQKKYKLKIIHMGGANGTDGVIEFEGIWLDKPSSGARGISPSVKSRTKSCLGKLLPHEENIDSNPPSKMGEIQAKRRVVEIVTSETPFHKFETNHGQKDFEEMIPRSDDIWYNQLQSLSDADTVVLSTSTTGLMASAGSVATVKDLFFRTGPPGTIHFPRPWSFKTYSPSVLILQLGLVDFVSFFSEPKNRNKRALDKFSNDFVDACIGFIRTIRATAYPFDSTSRPGGGEVMDLQDDGSYIYNSAPSTLPIFLITPFSATRYFVTRKLKLDRVISNALSQVSMTLQAHGGKSTFWVDTSGWLDPNDDFEGSHYNSSPEASVMTDFGNFKVASLLADHLCPYIVENKNGPGDLISISQRLATGDNGSCPFDRYDNYLGNVYLPKDVEFDRAMLERKIEMVKERFNLEI